ncbi:MAG TPA: hemerythrin domain-containing protein [Anaeromyxobacteraceae bacterium]
MPAHALTATPLAREEAARRREAAARQAAPDDPDRLRGAALAARLAEHHARVRRALPYAVALLAKVAARHRARNAKLAVLGEAGEELAEALDGWLEEEERDLFPALRAEAPAGDELERTARRHGELGLLMARVRWLADDFALPAWSGRSYQALMEELQGLEQTLLEHLRLERSALGPRQDGRSRQPEGDRPEDRARLEPAPGEVRQARAAGAPDAR